MALLTTLAWTWTLLTSSPAPAQQAAPGTSGDAAPAAQPADAMPADAPPAAAPPTDAGTPASLPSDPLPSAPLPSDPLPSDPLPSDPLPSDPLPSDPLPSDPLPSDPLPSDPLPSDPLPSDPLPSDPLPSDPLPAPPEPTDATTPAGRLEAALRAYHGGQHDLALSQLLTLLREQEVAPEVERDAQIYIGEIFFVQGNEAGAREAFELVLQASPDLALDPFQHPPDVCAFFELVRHSGALRAPPPPQAVDLAAPSPSPWLPLGLAQLRQDRVGPGVLVAVSQVASCGVSLTLGTWLLLDRSYGSRNEAGFDEETGQRLWSLETLQTRRTVQWAATGACYGTYAIGVTDAWLVQRRKARQAPQAHAPLAPTLVIAGRF